MSEAFTSAVLPIAMTARADQPKDIFQEAADKAAANEDLNHQNPAMTQVPAPGDRIPPRKDFTTLPPETSALLVATDPGQKQREDLERQGERENDEQQERTGQRSDFARSSESDWRQTAMAFFSRLGSLGLRPNLT